MKPTALFQPVHPFRLVVGWLKAITDFLFGYDVFISYAWADGTEYPPGLSRRLQERRFKVFLDQEIYLPGEDLSQATRRRVRMSTLLIVILRPSALRSPWVLREVQESLAAGRTPLVININGTFEAA